jgi:hypothetical protein
MRSGTLLIMSSCTLLIHGAHRYNHAHISSKMMSVISEHLKERALLLLIFRKKMTNVKFMESCTTLH